MYHVGADTAKLRRAVKAGLWQTLSSFSSHSSLLESPLLTRAFQAPRAPAALSHQALLGQLHLPIPQGTPWTFHPWPLGPPRDLTESSFTLLQDIWHLLCIRVVLVVKNLPINAGDTRDSGLIPGSGRSPGEGHDNPLQDSCLENPMDRKAWWATVHEVAKSQT